MASDKDALTRGSRPIHSTTIRQGAREVVAEEEHRRGEKRAPQRELVFNRCGRQATPKADVRQRVRPSLLQQGEPSQHRSDGTAARGCRDGHEERWKDAFHSYGVPAAGNGEQ